MAATTYRFDFDADVPLAEAEETLHLACFAAEGLHSRARVRLEVRYDLDEARNAIVVQSASEVGTAVARIYASLLLQEFGDSSFAVRQVRQQEAGVEGAVA